MFVGGEEAIRVDCENSKVYLKDTEKYKISFKYLTPDSYPIAFFRLFTP